VVLDAIFAFKSSMVGAHAEGDDMRYTALVAAVVSAFMLSGCGVVRKMEAEQKTQHENDLLAQLKLTSQQVFQECLNRYNINELDIIRNKVELSRNDLEGAAPFDILSNNTYPTEQESASIKIWAGLRDTCLTKMNQEATPIISQMNPANQLVINTRRGFGKAVAQQIGYLIVALYEKKITYSEFAKKRTDFSTASANADRDYIKAMQEQNYQRRMEQAKLAQEQFANQQRAWAQFFQGLQAMQPRAPSVSTAQCTQFGNTVNCVGVQR
jgi:hypothetical protein